MPNKRKSATVSQLTAQSQSKIRFSTPLTSLNSWEPESKSTERSVTWVSKSTLPAMPARLQFQPTLHSQRDIWSTWPRSTSRSTVWENSCTSLPPERPDIKSNISTFNKKELMNNDLDTYLNIFNIRSLRQLFRLNMIEWKNRLEHLDLNFQSYLLW